MTRLAALLDPSRIAVLDRLPDGRPGLLRLLAERLADAHAIPGLDAPAIIEALATREQLATTAVGEGLAFPHAKLPGLPAARASVVLLPAPGLDLGAADGLPVRLVVALIVPPDSIGEHLKLLGAFSRRLRDPTARQALLGCIDGVELLRRLGDIDVLPR
ncbi:MAG: PTS sugar transporter subunit IIA [Deltaproteobacteria bacterium]|nr:PTS sugar transporter subunit IIA [Deltaproteobacteria bacterium]